MQLAISIPFPYRSLMLPLSKLNAIEIHEAGRRNSEALWTVLCTNSDGFSASISKLVNFLQIAVDVHSRTFWTITEKSDDQNNNSSSQPIYTSMCFDPAKYEKLDHNVHSQNIEFVKCIMLWIALQKKSVQRHLSWSMHLSLTNWLIHCHKQSRVNGLMLSSNLYLGSKM